jgi:Zn-finger nucleic acid-binding protein
MRTCPQCDTTLTEEQAQGFTIHVCSNCHRRFIFGIETNARYMQMMNEREHQKLT